MRSKKLTSISQKISRLTELRESHIYKLLNPKPMIIGSLYEVYKTCNKANCCCQKGKKHGPFPALSMSIGAKRKVKMVRKEDLIDVRKKALSYRSFQQGLAKVRKINKEIDALLEEVKREFLEEYR